MNDADPALLGHRDGKTAFRHGIHGCGKQGQVEGNIAGQPGSQANIAGKNLGVCGDEQYVVESQSFLQQSHGL